MAKVLIAGSDPAVRDARALVIEFGGHHCRTANSLEEVLTLIQQEPFDLIVTDFKTNGSSPEAIVKRLTAAVPEAAVMVLTEPDNFIVKAAAEMLVSPCPPDSLLHHIEQVLRKAGDHRGERPSQREEGRSAENHLRRAAKA